jgi:heat shock protein HslJ
MNNRFLALTGAVLLVIVVLVIIFVQGSAGPTAQPTGVPADPQVLMIPRWFLNSLTLDGQKIEVMPDQQAVTIQFEGGGKANGTGSCNSFFADYGAGMDGSLKFGPVGSTKMACDSGMDQENAYFTALEKVERFEIVDGNLRLFSTDGKTEVVFRKPPK